MNSGPQLVGCDQVPSCTGMRTSFVYHCGGFKNGLGVDEPLDLARREYQKLKADGRRQATARRP